jgi:hypothetical protein
MLRRKFCDLHLLEYVVSRESDLLPDGGGPFCFSPHAGGDMKLLEDREQGTAIDFREMNQGAGICDCG